MDERKKILPRTITGLSFQQQKKFNKAVKNARILGMYPFTMPLM
jgi:ribosomal protein S18